MEVGINTMQTYVSKKKIVRKRASKSENLVNLLSFAQIFDILCIYYDYYYFIC